MTISPEACVATLTQSVRNAQRHEQPYRHWFLSRCLPEDVIEAVLGLPFEAPDLGGVSGKRELHNATRKYFDVANRAKFPVCAAIAQALQEPSLTREIERMFATKLDGSYLRIEYAQDTNGFWLEPHTDLGVKLFTCLLYLSKVPSHADLGTDIYDKDKRRVGRSPFRSNGAMVFVPSDITFHGFEPRPIEGVRKSLVINYVTEAWRAREQLAFPDQPICH
ncbi:MAG TPA: 2OG-Fe(II) oxygenase [Hyphomicrobiaceae bacterium]|nr:2OG-Fe(II) oxygenase [Hyphomicrobiaceae bacterium]